VRTFASGVPAKYGFSLKTLLFRGLQKRLIPNYAKIKIPNNSSSAKHTQRKTQNLRIEN